LVRNRSGELAIEHGADINSQSQAGTVRVKEPTFGTTALMNAAKAERAETVTLTPPECFGRGSRRKIGSN
jgi:hypothetical protein